MESRPSSIALVQQRVDDLTDYFTQKMLELEARVASLETPPAGPADEPETPDAPE